MTVAKENPWQHDSAVWRSQRPWAPISARLSRRLDRAGAADLQRAHAIRPYWYSHGNPYVHRDPPAPARHNVVQPTYALIGFPAPGCPAVRWTTIVPRVPAC